MSRRTDAQIAADEQDLAEAHAQHARAAAEHVATNHDTGFYPKYLALAAEAGAL